ncbi:MAG: methyltransferase domain-containing protein [Chitinophagaceae bacterium]|nr:methyltransferase domain-containing protein [Chitinophagaceae bacterium]
MLKFFIQKSNPKPARVVDIGSGDAFLAAGVAEKYMSINVSAVDINYNEELISIIRTGKPANLAFYRKIDEIQQAEPINIVILMDVLEHVEKPIDMLEKIIQLKAVNKETLFVITVPAYQKLFSKHDVNLGHFKRYNLKEIKSVLISSNLTVIASGYSFSSLLLIRRPMIYWEKKKKSEAEPVLP